MTAAPQTGTPQRPSGGLPVSILDRANTRAGPPDAAALRHAVERAQRAEALGFARFWVAEHHGVPGVAGSAPAVLMAAVAAATERIRVGSGGVMLPAHQPLVVAEQAATLEALFPGRIDLGLGRSLGFTPAVRAALRQEVSDADRFDADLTELQAYLDGTAAITARPAAGTPPLFVLATGTGVDVAAQHGLAVVVGGPALGRPEVLARYREQFRPSARRAVPHLVVSVNVVVADSAADARRLLLPEAWALAHARTRGEFPPLEPVGAYEQRTPTARERSMVDDSVASSIAGTPDEVAEQVAAVVARTGADELLVTGSTFDTEAQARSDELLAELAQQLRRT
jgi:luciferase family oxidoreductase group 1